MANIRDQWTREDASSLREFISKNPKFILRLRKDAPKIEGTTMEQRAMSGSEAQGFQGALESIENMMQDTADNTHDANFIE